MVTVKERKQQHTKSFNAVRRAILDRLEEIGKSALWLSREQKIVHPVSAQAFLYSERDTSATVICEMLLILDMLPVSSNTLCKRCKERNNWPQS